LMIVLVGMNVMNRTEMNKEEDSPIN